MSDEDLDYIIVGNNYVINYTLHNVDMTIKIATQDVDLVREQQCTNDRCVDQCRTDIESLLADIVSGDGTRKTRCTYFDGGVALKSIWSKYTVRML